MDAIAAEAGVGKGTLFRRFGDRAALGARAARRARARFQEAFIRGEPPLGPGRAARRAPASPSASACSTCSRRTATCCSSAEGGDLRAAALRRLGGVPLARPMLVRRGGPDLDEDVCAGMLLAALSARTFFHQRRGRGMALERLKAGWGSLVRRLLF